LINFILLFHNWLNLQTTVFLDARMVGDSWYNSPDRQSPHLKSERENTQEQPIPSARAGANET
jgi:hypothetical protein